MVINRNIYYKPFRLWDAIVTVSYTHLDVYKRQVVNHVVKLTAEEKAEARQNAVRKYQEEELRKLQNRHRPSARKENQPQPSLFDLGL